MNDPRPSPIRDAIVAEVARRGLTTYQLAKMAGHGIDPTRIRRFLKDERDLSLATVEVLFAALGLAVTGPNAPGDDSDE